MRRLLAVLLFFAILSFGLGISQPLMQIRKLQFFSEEPSLVGMVMSLWQGGDYALMALILAVSILFPAVKLLLLLFAAMARDREGMALPGWVRALSKWSMLDVVLVALVVFAAKTSGLASAFVLPGLWFFAASVILTMAAAALVKKLGAEH